MCVDNVQLRGRPILVNLGYLGIPCPSLSHQRKILGEPGGPLVYHPIPAGLQHGCTKGLANEMDTPQVWVGPTGVRMRYIDTLEFTIGWQIFKVERI